MKFKRIKFSHNTWMTIGVIVALISFATWITLQKATTPEQLSHQQEDFKPEITKTDEQWRSILSTQQFHVLRERGTDAPFSEDMLLHEKRPGTFVTADCNEPVFRSEQKYDSGTGWPSFWAPIEGSIVEISDNTLGLVRTEVVGKKCGGHLGHVFTDGPLPTGLRYCINPSALKFIPD